MLVLNVRMYRGCKESCYVRGEAVQMFAMWGAVTILGRYENFHYKYWNDIFLSSLSPFQVMNVLLP